MKYVFVPFDRITEQNFLDSVRFMHGQLVLASEEASQTLSWFQPGVDQLHVMGHCEAGSDKLGLDVAGKETATATEVVSRLLRVGLPSRQNMPKIEVTLIACEAKSGSTSKPAFATLLEQALKAAKYVNVTVNASRHDVVIVGQGPVQLLPETSRGRPGGIVPLTGPGPSSPRPRGAAGSGLRPAK